MVVDQMKSSQLANKFLRRKENKDTLVFLNGTFNTLEDWEAMGTYFFEKENYNVLQFDMRNQGNSFKSNRDFAYEDILEDIKCLLVSLEIQKPILIAYSSATSFVVDLTSENPELAKQVILSAPVVNPYGMFRTRLLHKALIGSLENGGVEDLFVLMYPLVFSSAFCEHNKNAFVAFTERFNATTDKDLVLPYIKAWMKNTVTLTKLQCLETTCPSAYIYGKEDVFNTGFYMKSLREELQKMEFHEIDNCGHALHIEDYEQYFTLLKDILRRDA